MKVVKVDYKGNISFERIFIESIERNSKNLRYEENFGGWKVLPKVSYIVVLFVS